MLAKHMSGRMALLGICQFNAKCSTSKAQESLRQWGKLRVVVTNACAVLLNRRSFEAAKAEGEKIITLRISDVAKERKTR